MQSRDDEEVLFREVQQFRALWLWVTMLPTSIILVGLFGYGMIKQLVFGMAWGDKPMTDLELAVVGPLTILLGMGLPYLFYTMKLIIEVRRDGVHVRFTPLRWCYIPFEDIKSFRACTYDPLWD